LTAQRNPSVTCTMHKHRSVLVCQQLHLLLERNVALSPPRL
jgi:hypothetical protein